MAGSWNLAIDFGTSNSAAAHTSPAGGAIEAVALSHRSNLMPSAIYVDSDSKNVVSGDSALLAGRRDPSRLVLSPKRFIDHETIELEGDDVQAQLVFAALIGDIVDRAKSQHAGVDPDTVTLTHPERWSHNAVGNLVDAAERAGIPSSKLRMISEPRAAAIHYAAQQKVPAGQHVAVFDFGGGTLDIAVLRAEHNGDYRVVAAKGDNSLGGRTIDNLVYRWVIEQIDHDDPDLADSLRTAPTSVMNALQENIREAKEMLSDTSSATVTISSPSGERDVLITRDEFNRVISSPIGRAAEMTRAVLGEAGVTSADTPIYLTGGSSRIPFVQDELGRVGRVMRLDDPKTVVCRGALVATLRGFTQSAQGGGQRSVAPGANPFGGPAQPPQAAQSPQRPQGQPAPGGVSRPIGQSETAQLPQSPRPGQRDQAGMPGQPGQFAGAGAAGGGGPYGQGPSQASGFASVPSSGAQQNKGGKGPLIAAGAVGVVALLGIGGWAVTRGGDDTDGSTEASSTAPSVNESGTAPADDTTSSAAASSPTSSTSSAPDAKYIPMGELIGDDGFLPQQFKDLVKTCQVEEDAAEEWIRWIEDTSVKSHWCNIPRDGDTESISYATILRDDNATAAIDIMKRMDGKDDFTVEEDKGGGPVVYMVKPDKYSGPNAIIYYPDKKFAVHLSSRGDDDAQKNAFIQDSLKELGFR
ncbi:Hsp70 family protein [Corynebacterium sp. CCUG 71335]|uniref:Hsp70 family protein n=1 Tax=Corynebacterium sp. CCUG 71335 TaxID=2823892 RepID=UPI00210C777A|nr:Hsp70 family protein [Corynebacterium sp. CCUG 71335]MCQ4621060.1 Hsp70 family protein [Corynebacterium sp. CCUG 71335]